MPWGNWYSIIWVLYSSYPGQDWLMVCTVMVPLGWVPVTTPYTSPQVGQTGLCVNCLSMQGVQNLWLHFWRVLWFLSSVSRQMTQLWFLSSAFVSVVVCFWGCSVFIGFSYTSPSSDGEKSPSSLTFIEASWILSLNLHFWISFVKCSTLVFSVSKLSVIISLTASVDSSLELTIWMQFNLQSWGLLLANSKISFTKLFANAGKRLVLSSEETTEKYLLWLLSPLIKPSTVNPYAITKTCERNRNWQYQNNIQYKSI